MEASGSFDRFLAGDDSEEDCAPKTTITGRKNSLYAPQDPYGDVFISTTLPTRTPIDPYSASIPTCTATRTPIDPYAAAPAPKKAQPAAKVEETSFEGDSGSMADAKGDKPSAFADLLKSMEEAKAEVQTLSRSLAVKAANKAKEQDQKENEDNGVYPVAVPRVTADPDMHEESACDTYSSFADETPSNLASVIASPTHATDEKEAKKKEVRWGDVGDDTSTAPPDAARSASAVSLSGQHSKSAALRPEILASFASSHHEGKASSNDSRPSITNATSVNETDAESKQGHENMRDKSAETPRRQTTREDCVEDKKVFVQQNNKREDDLQDEKNKKELMQRQKELEDAKMALSAREDALTQRENSVHELEKTLRDKEDKLENREFDVAQKEEHLIHKEVMLEVREEDVRLKMQAAERHEEARDGMAAETQEAAREEDDTKNDESGTAPCAEVEHLEHKVNELTGHKRKLEHKVDMLEELVTSVQAQKVNLAQEVTTLEMDIVRWRLQCSQGEEKVAKLEQELRRRADLDIKQDQLTDEWNSKERALQDQNVKLQHDNEDLRAQLLILKNATLVAPDEEVVVTAEEKKSLDALQKELDMQNTLLLGYQQENDRLAKQNRELRQLFKANEKQHGDKIVQLQAQLNNATGDDSSVAKAPLDLKARIVEAEKQLAVEQHHAQELQRDLEHCREQKQLLEKELATTPAQVEESAAAKEQMAKAHASEVRQLNEKICMMQEKITWYAEGHERLCEDRKELERLRDENRHLRNMKSEKERSAGEKKLHARIADLEKLAEELSSAGRAKRPDSIATLIHATKPSLLERAQFCQMKTRVEELERQLALKDDQHELRVRELRAKFDKLMYDSKQQQAVTNATAPAAYSAEDTVDNSGVMVPKTADMKAAVLQGRVKDLERMVEQTKKYYLQKLRAKEPLVPSKKESVLAKELREKNAVIEELRTARQQVKKTGLPAINAVTITLTIPILRRFLASPFAQALGAIEAALLSDGKIHLPVHLEPVDFFQHAQRLADECDVCGLRKLVDDRLRQALTPRGASRESMLPQLFGSLFIAISGYDMAEVLKTDLEVHATEGSIEWDLLVKALERHKLPLMEDAKVVALPNEQFCLSEVKSLFTRSAPPRPSLFFDALSKITRHVSTQGGQRLMTAFADMHPVTGSLPRPKFLRALQELRVTLSDAEADALGTFFTKDGQVNAWSFAREVAATPVGAPSFAWSAQPANARNEANEIIQKLEADLEQKTLRIFELEKAVLPPDPVTTRMSRLQADVSLLDQKLQHRLEREKSEHLRAVEQLRHELSLKELKIQSLQAALAQKDRDLGIQRAEIDAIVQELHWLKT